MTTDESDILFSDNDSDKENEESVQTPKILEETASVEDSFAELDQETLDILGDDSSLKDEGKFMLHPRLALAWEKILLEGLRKDKKIELLEKYPRKGNCPIQSPKLNPEIAASVKDTIKNRDKYLSADQELCGAGLSALEVAINRIFEGQKQQVNTKDLLTVLIASGKLMCELFNQLTKARKTHIPGTR